jgi:hypothetical protein
MAEPIPAFVAEPKLPARGPFDCADVRSVTAFVLLHDGELAGKIVASHGQSRVTAGVWVWGGPLREMPSTWGTASGYGYCKLSAAVADALGRAIAGKYPGWGGEGEGAIRRHFEAFGYTLHRVI